LHYNLYDKLGIIIMKLKNLTAVACLSLLGATANAGIVSFDGATKNGGLAETGTAGGAGATFNGTEPVGQTLTFNDFVVTAGQSKGLNLAKPAGGKFDLSDNISSRRVYQDWGNAGLGAVSYSSFSGDGIESNVGSGSNNDEVLFFDFGIDAILETVWFNGGHKEQVKSDNDGNLKDGSDALFNIFVSTDGDKYSSIFAGGQQQPTDLDYLSTGLDSAYRYYAVAATGWGDHSSYVEAIEYSEVPEPGTLALLGLGLMGLGFARRKTQA
jgi:hypothetical protein